MLLGSILAHADKFSYLYIQGDQKTPFYVKLEDAMQPRFSKNYCIIPKLAPGPVRIEILFQQNLFPPQEFNIQVPEDGSRGFLLVNNKEKGFLLYDLQQGFYLKAGNQISEDRVPVKAAPAAASVTTIPEVKSASKSNPAPKVEVPKAEVKTTVPKTETQSGTLSPVFIQDLELSHKSDKSENEIPVQKSAEEKSGAASKSQSDCEQPLSSEQFEPLFTQYSGMEGDEGKLEFFYGKLDACYQSWQARSLAERLGSDAARFELLKKIYPRISDRKSFSLLDDLITDETWKAEFNKLIHP